MAIVGGTASAIGGGKFSNGAMGSAFQYLFNDALANFVSKVDENSRRTQIDNETFRKEIGFEGPDSDINEAKQILSVETIRGSLKDIHQAIKDGMIIAVPHQDVGTIINAIAYIYVPENGSIIFQYDCKTVDQCGVKMYEKK